MENGRAAVRSVRLAPSPGERLLPCALLFFRVWGSVEFMKLLPMIALAGALLLAPAVMAASPSVQQLLSDAQTAFIRGDLAAAKQGFTLVTQIEPRNQLALNYLRMIAVKEAQAPKGNDMEKRLSTVIIPKVDFKEVTLGSALDYLRQTVAKVSDGKASVNFVVQLPEDQVKTQPVTLVLSNVPFTEVLRYLGDVAGLQFEYEKYAV